MRWGTFRRRMPRAWSRSVAEVITPLGLQRPLQVKCRRQSHPRKDFPYGSPWVLYPESERIPNPQLPLFVCHGEALLGRRIEYLDQAKERPRNPEQKTCYQKKIAGFFICGYPDLLDQHSQSLQHHQMGRIINIKQVLQSPGPPGPIIQSQYGQSRQTRPLNPPHGPAQQCETDSG